MEMDITRHEDPHVEALRSLTTALQHLAAAASGLQSMGKHNSADRLRDHIQTLALHLDEALVFDIAEIQADATHTAQGC